MASPTGIALDFGGAFRTLDAITYRPQTGQLYGFDDDGDTVYLLEPASGQATAVASQPNLTSNDDLGFDFNDQLDAARIVTAENENRVFFPDNTSPDFISATDLFFVAGDPNEGLVPNMVGNAYINPVRSPSTTSQFGIDSDWDILATLGNNAGTLQTVGELFLDGAPFDVTEDAGFDILSFSEGDNTAFAPLTEFGTATQSIFEVPLTANGAGAINLVRVATLDRSFGTLDSLAVAPIPLPAAFPLMAAGLALLTALRRSRRVQMPPCETGPREAPRDPKSSNFQTSA